MLLGSDHDEGMLNTKIRNKDETFDVNFYMHMADRYGNQGTGPAVNALWKRRYSKYPTRPDVTGYVLR